MAAGTGSLVPSGLFDGELIKGGGMDTSLYFLLGIFIIQEGLCLSKPLELYKSYLSLPLYEKLNPNSNNIRIDPMQLIHGPFLDPIGIQTLSISNRALTFMKQFEKYEY